MGETTARLRSKGGNNSSSSSSGGGDVADEKTKRRLSVSGNDHLPSVSESAMVGQSSESSSSSSWWRTINTARQHRAWLIRFAAMFVFGLVLSLRSSSSSSKSSFDSSSGNGKPQKLVPPLRGQAYLSPDEFLDIRESHGYESVLVTGGLGFIGSHVVELLLHRGFHVTILDDESNGHNHNPEAVELVPRDVSVVSDLPSYPTIMKNENGRKEDAVAVTTTTTTAAAAATTKMLVNYSNIHHQREIQEQKGGEEGHNYYFTHVIHLAAAISVSESMTNPEKYERINYDGSQNLLDWIRGYNEHVSTAKLTTSTATSTSSSTSSSSLPRPTTIRRVVAASSAAIYGDPNPDLLPLQESAPYGGLSPYADTKYRMEGLMRDFVTRQNEEKLWSLSTSTIAATQQTTTTTTSAVALRFFNVYGPRQDPKNPYSGVISLFLDMAATGRDITILGDGEMTRDFVYVKDVARAIVLALLQDNDKEISVDNNHEGKRRHEEATFNVYNVCTGKSITINSLAARVRQSMKSVSTIKHLDPRVGDIRESSCDPTGAEHGIGFRAAVSQESGLEKTADWFRLEQ